ncbi:tail tape measure protein [Pseudomonas gessardii]|uniref:tail tape measure protein n=1 Tax=Pseudomonas gessardii TaxID=78544 RepID=UPI0018D8D144|nr:tail tape measure protein [Pseudomonas gessardii]MBH3420761.1 tail tape measure protein [Pseudomonas gessardii]
MQDARYTLKLADEDKRWMSFPGLAESGASQLSGLLDAQDERLVGPSSVDVATAPPSELGLALANASLHIHALTEEQVRLRESLETLNSSLFIAGGSPLGSVAASPAPVVQEAAKDKEPAADPWYIKGAKWLGEGYLDTARGRLTGKAVDVTLGKLPGVGKLFRDDSKDCCCPGATETLQGRARFLPKKTLRQRPTKRSSSKKTTRSGSRLVGSMATLQGVLGRAGQAFDGPKMGFQGAPLQADRPAPRLGERSSEALVSPVRGPVLLSTPAPALPKAIPSSLVSMMSKLESVGTRSLAPLRYADTAINLVQGVRNGDLQAVGSSLGTAGGAWAGATAGAALGTLVLPGVGTAVGGVIGGLLGGEAGTWLGEKLFPSSNRLPAPEALSKDLNSARSDNVQVTLAPSIQITGVNPADAQQVVDRVLQTLQNQCVPMLTDSLAVRRNAALTDGGD